MADPGLVVVIDIGTTGVKVAAAVDHAAAVREYPTSVLAEQASKEEMP